MAFPSIAAWKRLFHAVMQGIRATWRAIYHQLVTLFHQVTGMFFLFFVLLGGTGCWREYKALHGAPWNARIWVAFVFTLMFAWFAALSFWEAAKVQKDQVQTK